MRIVALEEHFAAPDLVQKIPPATIAARGWPSPDRHVSATARQPEAAETGEARLQEMDAAGVTLQVLSVSGPDPSLLPADTAPTFAREYNDRLASVVQSKPDRYAAFAILPMSAPDAAADELERCVRNLGFHGALVNGVSDGLFLDDTRFDAILARAATLDVPLYLHPSIPPEPVRKAYYDNLPGNAGFLLSSPGFGWHIETAIHVLRLVLSGALDRHRNLKLIVGHMGETLPVMLQRFDNIFGPEAQVNLSRTVSQTILDQVWITTSGIFGLPAFMAAYLAFGADRILFSVDYPFTPSKPATEFLARLPVPPADREKIAHGNADRLLKLTGTQR